MIKNLDIIHEVISSNLSIIIAQKKHRNEDIGCGN